MSQRALMLPLWTKTHISLTTVAGPSSMHFLGKIEKNGHRCGFIYRFCRRHWGSHRESLPVASGRSVRPVPQADRLSSLEATMIATLTFGLIQRPGMTNTWHLWTVIIPRRTITGRLVRGQVWRRHDGRHWLYKKVSA
jgi:hypothetical protein